LVAEKGQFPCKEKPAGLVRVIKKKERQKGKRRCHPREGGKKIPPENLVSQMW